MIKALDPRLSVNWMPSDRVRQLGFRIARSPEFANALQPRSISRITDTVIEQTNPEQTKQNIQKLVSCIVAGRLILPHVMEIDYARSEEHILGEICHIMRAVRTQAVHGDVKQIKILKDLARIDSEEGWVSTDFGMTCPTIDGNSSMSQLHGGRSGNLSRHSPVHTMWMHYFSTYVFDNPAKFDLCQLDAPFPITTLGGLTTTDFVTAPHVRFFHGGTSSHSENLNTCNFENR